MKILVINGPNLNLLGKREPEIYGNTDLEKINNELTEYAKTLNNEIEIEFFQSNHEGDIVDKIQTTDANGLIINPAAYTHTSVAISDAIKGVKIKAVEVHLSNVSAREEFRKISYVSGVCLGTVAGFKQNSYKMALFGLYNELKNNE
ncbi:MAG: type II 3-dehydroquinate dehydratase [Candidatus Gastranaerophilales bacterium]|nr:type II 3-dehydroquinate dehydratase [Candidatus Gastranaerophilales bacterium]